MLHLCTTLTHTFPGHLQIQTMLSFVFLSFSIVSHLEEFHILLFYFIYIFFNWDLEILFLKTMKMSCQLCYVLKWFPTPYPTAYKDLAVQYLTPKQKTNKTKEKKKTQRNICTLKYSVKKETH